jgi:hypothetical protein
VEQRYVEDAVDCKNPTDFDSDIESVIAQTEELLKSHRKKLGDTLPEKERLPYIRYDKNSKKISVTYAFNLGSIPFKLIAHRDVWRKLWETRDFDSVPFELVEPLLSRPSRELKDKIRQFSISHPDDFSAGISLCVDQAVLNDPSYDPSRKPRGRFYDFDWQKMNEIRGTARHLYCYLDHNREKVRTLLESYGRIKEFDDYLEKKEKLTPRLELALSTMLIIEEEFDWDLQIRNPEDEGTLSCETFYNEYISVRSIRGMTLTHLKNSKRIKEGDSPLLEPILERIKK